MSVEPSAEPHMKVEFTAEEEEVLAAADRDPRNINAHVKVELEEVLAEPDGVRTIACCWALDKSLFTCSKFVCYNLCSVLFGWLAALSWGCEFGIASCVYVFCLTPRIRMYALCCKYFQDMITICLRCCLVPMAEACGLCLSNIQVKRATLV